ncbi:hypothetical protein LSAT2_011468, partial [Lamellibrachia satsuma]
LAASFAFTIVGGFVCTASSCGYSGATQDGRCRLQSSIYILVFLMPIQIVALCLVVTARLFSTKVVNSRISPFLFNSQSHVRSADGPLTDGATLDENGTLTRSLDTASKELDFLMSCFGCCGVTNYTDFRVNATKWNSIYTYKGVTINATVPLMCCKTRHSRIIPDNIDVDAFLYLQLCLQHAYRNATNLMVGNIVLDWE